MKLLLLLLAVWIAVGLAQEDGGTGGEDGKSDRDEAPEEPEEPDDPCLTHECTPERECLNQNGKPVCVCKRQCRPSPQSYGMGGNRYQVCTNQNQTFSSMCALKRTICQCTDGTPDCKDRGHKSARLKYYGSCRWFGNCPDEELQILKERLRGWVFNMMLHARFRLTEGARELARKAISAQKRHVLPWLWFFCYLDREDRDGSLTEEELLPFSANLMSVEVCSEKFLKSCDPDGNNRITLNEWSDCLGLERDEVDDVCDDVHGARVIN